MVRQGNEYNEAFFLIASRRGWLDRIAIHEYLRYKRLHEQLWFHRLSIFSTGIALCLIVVLSIDVLGNETFPGSMPVIPEAILEIGVLATFVFSMYLLGTVLLRSRGEDISKDILRRVEIEAQLQAQHPDWESLLTYVEDSNWTEPQE